MNPAVYGVGPLEFAELTRADVNAMLDHHNRMVRRHNEQAMREEARGG